MQKTYAMKKTILVILLTFIFALAACGSDITSGGVVVRGEMGKPKDIVGRYADECIVYTTQSGTRYHNADCSYLKSSRIPVSLEQAILEGKEPCSRCHPPAPIKP